MSDSLSPTLTQLRDYAGRLHSLLSDPQPGLLTWTSMVAREWTAICDLGDPTKQEQATQHTP